jgi:hypothetical protein
MRARGTASVLALFTVGVAGDIQVRDLAGNLVDPFGRGERSAYVFVFVRPDCPISNRYAPELARLHERFTPRGVVFALVYPGDQTGPDAIRAHVREYRYPFVALRDPGFSFADSVDASVTPEAAVFDSRRTLRYLGRIDDRYISAGQMRPAATRHDLQEALELILSGRPLEQTRVPAVGCLIADLR